MRGGCRRRRHRLAPTPGPSYCAFRHPAAHSEVVVRSCHATPNRAGSSLAVVGALALTAFLPACERAASTTGEPELDALPPLLAEVDMRIGSVDDPEIGFSRISGVDVDRDV